MEIQIGTASVVSKRHAVWVWTEIPGEIPMELLGRRVRGDQCGDGGTRVWFVFLRPQIVGGNRKVLWDGTSLNRCC